MCGVCDAYYRADKDGLVNESLRETYQIHKSEKDKVREVKMKLKLESSPSEVLACFDLEQVLYLPKTNKCGIFYKRRLSCYNFTIYDVKDKTCDCYFWHECVAGRGSNEIASCLSMFIRRMDNQGKTKIFLFSDSCSGQNRNTVVLTMLLNILEQTENIREITLHFFEPHHGQNEGDSEHSCVERAISRVSEIFLSGELAMVIAMSRKQGNNVTNLETSEIKDWKKMSADLGVIRCRASDDGISIDWTKVKQLKVSKENPMKIGFKMSHNIDEWSWLNLRGRRQARQSESCHLQPAFRQSPMVSVAKYKDIMDMMSGAYAIISNPEHQLFYRNLRN